MDFVTAGLVGVGLAMDAFAVSLGVGTSCYGRQPRSVFRLSFHFGLFQGLMTFLGWLAGSAFASLISAVDHWVALALLVFVGGRMIRQGLQPVDEKIPCADPSKGGTLVMLCVATSIDAMAVGLGLALIQVDILQSSLIIAGVTFLLSLFGLLMGGGLGAHFGKRMEILGGLILNGIGLRIVFTHIF